MAAQTLHPADWAIFTLTLLITLGIGVYYACTGGEQRTNAEYLTANRKMNFLAGSVSLIASFFSAILIIGIPAEGYLYGGQYWLMIVGFTNGCILAVLLFVPVFYPLQLTSITKYLEMRFNSKFVQILGTLSSVTTMVVYSAIIFFSPATSIQALVGFPTWASLVIGCAIAIIYTTIGGIKAVIGTDVFQALLILAGLLALTIRGIIVVGGISEVWRICTEWHRLDIIDTDPDPTVRLTFWSLVVGSTFHNLTKFGTSQAAVQRYCSTSSITKARLLVLGVIPWSVLSLFLSVLCGITMFAFYQLQGCDLNRGGFVRNPNQMIPRFLADILDFPGIKGLFLASLASASFSSASSTLNSSAANLWEDILRVIWPNLPEKRNVLITKLLVVVVGIVSCALSTGVSKLGGTVIQMVITFLSASAGPTTGMYLMGIFLPFTNWIGAATGGVTGFIVAMWMSFGSYTIKRYNVVLPTTVTNCSTYAMEYNAKVVRKVAAAATTTIGPDVNHLHNFYSISYLWIALYAILITITVGVVVSMLTGMNPRPVERRLLHPLVRCCYKHADNDDDKHVIYDKYTERENAVNGKDNMNFNNLMSATKF